MRIKVNDNVFVRRPTHEELSDAQLYASKMFNKARMSGAVLRIKLNDYMKEQGLWDDAKAKEFEEVTNKLNGIIGELEQGSKGKYKKLSEARKVAIEARVLRMRQTMMLAESRRLDAYTVEGQAENARFDFLVTKCVVDAEDHPLFSSVEEYFESQEEWAAQAAEELSYVLHPDLDKEWQDKLPENEFLLKHGFVNKELELIDKEGNLVDPDFHKIGEEPPKPEFEEFEVDL